MFEFRHANRPFRAVAALCAGLMLTAAAQATPVSYTGIFAFDNDLRFFAPLNITAAGGTISGQTFSHSGGTNYAGAAIAAGGFIPTVALFDNGTGMELQRVTAGASTCGGPPYCLDIEFNFILSMGSYTLVLSQDGNLPAGDLMDGYTQDANRDYAGGFVQFDGSQRDGHWALDIDITNNLLADVPEPGSLALLVAALGASLAVRRRRIA